MFYFGGEKARPHICPTSLSEQPEKLEHSVSFICTVLYEGSRKTKFVFLDLELTDSEMILKLPKWYARAKTVETLIYH